MAAAHRDALLAILDACTPADLNSMLAQAITRDIAAVYIWAPASVAGDPRLQAALAKCLAALPQVRTDMGCDAANRHVAHLPAHTSHVLTRKVGTPI